MLNYEWSRNYLGLQYGEHNKERYVFDQNIFLSKTIALLEIKITKCVF